MRRVPEGRMEGGCAGREKGEEKGIRAEQGSGGLSGRESDLERGIVKGALCDGHPGNPGAKNPPPNK